MIWNLRIALVIVSILPGLSFAQGKILPLELSRIAKEMGCEQIENFFERESIIFPPFVYGYLPGDEESSVAFWCLDRGRHKYLLVTKHSFENDERFSCPRVLEKDTPPWGLSVSKEKRIPLNQFVFADNPRSRGPTNRVTLYPPLRDYSDGIETLYYCHLGKWMVRVRH